jgi:CDP-glucose 4,6-dehydratase
MTGFWADKRVFITGATGLVGSWLARDLVQRGAYVVALIRDWDPLSEFIRSGTVHKTTVVNGSLQDYASIERAISEHEIDTVFHLGAQALVGTAYRSPLITFESNIRGTYNVLEACRVHANLVKRVVIASSDKAYGACQELPYLEDMPPLGRHPYDVSKSCADLLTQAYFWTYGLPVVIARCGNIYGGGDLNWSRIIPGTIRSLIQDERPLIRSDGNMIRDYIYVVDIIRAYKLMAEASDRPEIVGQAFNFGPKKPISVSEIVDLLRNLMGRQDLSPIILNQTRAEIHCQYLSAEKAAKRLGWHPEHSLESGLHQTITWYKSFLRTPHD